MTSNHLLLYRLAELMLEHERHILPVDLLFDDEQIGDFVKSIQIDSPYQQMLLEGVLTESVREEKLFVSFTVEGYFHYVLGEVINNQTNGKGPECLKQIVEENKLNGAKEGVEQCLIRNVLVDDLSRLTWLIDVGEEMLELCVIPLLYSVKTKGVESTIVKLLENPTENDWNVLLKLDNELLRLELHVLRKEFLEAVMPLNQINIRNSLLLSLKALFIIEKEKSLIYLSKINYKKFRNDEEILFELGCFEYFNENFVKSKEIFERCYKLRRKEIKSGFKSYTFLLGEVSNQIGLLHLDNKEYKKSIKYFLKSKKQFYPKEDKISVIYNLGLSYKYLNKNKIALKYFTKSLQLSITKYGNYHLITCFSLESIALLHKRNGDLKKAFEFMTKVLKIKTKILDDYDYQIAKSQNNFATILIEMQEYDSAEIELKNCIKILEKIEFKHSLKFSIYQNLEWCYESAILFYDKKDIEKKIEYYYKIKDLKINYFNCGESDIALVDYDLGLSFKETQKYESAILFFLKGYKTLKKGGIPFQIAQCYESINQPNEAQDYYIQSAEIRKVDIGIDDEATQEAKANAIRLSKELGNGMVLPDWMIS